MKKIFSTLALLLVLALPVGCSSQVPPGYVGKKVSTSGVQPDIYEQGKHFHGFFTRMILINASSELRKAPVRVIMADYDTDREGNQTRRIGLEMDFDVNVRYRIKDDERVVNSMLSDMTLDDDTDRITAQQMYQKYGNMVVGRVGREVLGNYTPEEILHNLEAINEQLFQGIKAGLNDSPLEVSSVSLGEFSLPRVISERISANKDTELKEAQATAQQRIDLLERQNQIELARQQAVREEVDARSMAQQNRILNESVTPEVLRLRELALREKEIEMMSNLAGNGNSTIFIPYGAVDSAGAQFRMFNQK